MRDILFLAHRFPYPPDRGDRIRSWHVLNALAKLAPVHVAAPFEEGDEAAMSAVARVAASVVTRRRSTSQLRAVARALWLNTPASVEAFVVPALQAGVRHLIDSGKIDTIYAFSNQMAAYVPDDFAGRFVMDFVDMDSAKFGALNGWANTIESGRLLKWETATARRAATSVFVSADEARQFTQITGQDATVLENGVDLGMFAPDIVPSAEVPHPLIVFTGQMDYAPNVAAVTAFARNVQPQLPHAVFAIVGRSPTAGVKALASHRVIVTGTVADTRPWLAAADVVVAPLSLARGVQNKILEAMAMGKAVVASTAAARGIDAVDGRDLIVTDHPATAIAALLSNVDRRTALGKAARERMVVRYAWDKQLAPLRGIMAR